jgi:hypothetical protein
MPSPALVAIPSQWAVVAISVGIVLAAAALTWDGKRVDTPTYEQAAVRMLEGEAIYRAADRPPFTYPPFFALVWVPFRLVPEAGRLLAWNLCNMTLLVAIVAQVVALVRPWVAERPGRTRRLDAICIGIVAVLGVRFLVSPLEYRAHDYVVLLAVLLSAGGIARGEQAAAGGWAGLATACKATPLLLLPMFVWQRRWRAAIVMAVATAALTLLPDLVAPQSTGRPWVLDWYDTFVSRVDVGAAAAAPGAWKSWNVLNQSLSGTLYRLFTPMAPGFDRWDVSLAAIGPTGLRLLVVGCQGAILAALAWGTWRTDDERPPDARSRFRTLGHFSAALCGMLLCSPMSSKQHFCGLFPAITFATCSAVYGRRSPLLLACLATVFVTGTLFAKDLLGSQARLQVQAYGATTLCAVACLAAVLEALRNLRTGDRP